MNKEIKKELAIRTLEKRYENKRNDLYEFIKWYLTEEKKLEFFDSWHYLVICDALEKVFEWKIKRLIINVPPRTWKTEFVTKGFPSWVLWKKENTKFIATGYSATLTQTFSDECRNILKTNYFKKIFPRFAGLSQSQDTKNWWNTKWGGQYYATGAGWTITGMWADIILIDDPLKPKDITGTEIIKVNNWYTDTLKSRLDNQNTGAIIIIMQRLHDNDLVWFLTDLEKKGWEKWEKIIIWAICESAETYETKYWTIKRPENNLLLPKKLNRNSLENLKKTDPQTFSSQYQQQPINKESQEFHEEWFRYFEDFPKTPGKILTTVDPAFSTKKESDESAITTVKMIADEVYILEQTAGRYNPAELEDKIIYHIKKWQPEKIWIEAFSAQVTVSFSLKNRLKKEQIYKTEVIEIKQKWDKESKIRSLIPWYRNGLIFHNRQNCDWLEQQLIRFPKAKHDDRADSLQMIYFLAETNPNINIWKIKTPELKYDKFWFVY